MEQCVLVAASVCNKSLITQSVTQQGLPKYQTLKTPTYQIDLFKKEINKILFANADFLVYKILFFPRIKLSTSQTSILDGVKTGFFLSDFAQQLRRTNPDVSHLYFTYLMPPLNFQLLIWIRMPKQKR